MWPVYGGCTFIQVIPKSIELKCTNRIQKRPLKAGDHKDRLGGTLYVQVFEFVDYCRHGIKIIYLIKMFKGVKWQINAGHAAKFEKLF